MNYLSVCSGIEAASCAWHPLGWTPVAFAEIEPLPSAVLAHHFPQTPNWGDMTKFREWPDAAIDVLVGGTPCQSFSVAGLRKGLADPRGNLMLTYLAIADRYRPAWLVWENVPGVLSSGSGRDFGTFLGGLGQLGYGFAYRILDAQFIRVESHLRAVPQRRRRVFVVGYLGDWRRAAAVLLERESLQGHPAPRREAGQGITGSLAARTKGGGGLGPDFDCAGGLIPANSLCLNGGGMGRLDSESETLIPTIGGGFDVAHSLKADGFDASEDGTGRATPLVALPLGTRIDRGGSHREAEGNNLLAIGFDCKASGQNGFGVGEIASTMRGMGHTDSHQSGGGHQAVAHPVRSNPRNNSNPVTEAQMHIQTGMQVRRLTPLECERLQGFPNGWTDIRIKGKPAADGPRYKALGNSMAVNCMSWLGQRIANLGIIA